MSELKPCPFCGEVPERVLTGMKMVKHYCGGFFDGWYGFNVWNRRPIEDKLQAELARRDEIIKRLKEDAERLAETFVIEVYQNEFICRSGCHHWSNAPERIEHFELCPITLHRALMKELE